MESRDKDVEELRTEVSCQSDRYDDLWLIHGTLLEEAHQLHSEVITLISGVRVEGTRVRLGVKNWSPEGPSSWPGGLGRQSGRSSDRAESSDSWHGRTQRGLTDWASGQRRE